MPKSKRDKDVALTKVKAKNRKEKKGQMAETIRQCLDEYPYVYVFAVDNLRSSKLSDIRQLLKADSRMFFGKNTIIQLALGRTAEEEPKENTHKVGKYIKGQSGLIFSSRTPKEMKSFLSDYVEMDYARGGNVATSSVNLEAGPMTQFSFAMEPQLRKLGLQTSLDKGVVTLEKDFSVCQEGNTLTPEQAKILMLLEYKMTEFRVSLKCVWSKKTSKVLAIKNKRTES